jgi:chaperone required for assembly of F1-ATPase
MKRFYSAAEARPTDTGFAVSLDGREVRTPGKAPLQLPTRALAEALAAEWARQGETILPETMPLTRLANVAIDRAPHTRAELAAHVAKYGETDLLCHRADRPESLVQRQNAAWDPLLDWAHEALGVSLVSAEGVLALNQPAESLARLKAEAEAMDDFVLTGLAHAAGLAGSAVIAFALARGRLDGPAAFTAAHLDDLFQLETWGEDEEARARLTGLEAEFAALEIWFRAL